MTIKNLTALTVVLSAMLLVAAACGTKDEGAGGNGSVQGNQTESSSNAGGTTTKSWSERPKMSIDEKKSYSATFVTNKGEFTVELYAKDAPETVNNFVFLSKEKFYDGVKFHRIVKDFVIQGGDPTGTGGGGPGYTIPDELGKGYKYDEGVLAMAKTSQPNSGGSQFFICTGEQAASLNATPDFTIFGKVSKGMDIVKAIAATPVTLDPNSGEPSVPKEDVIIKTIKITEQ